jgi:hypothetical protein
MTPEACRRKALEAQRRWLSVEERIRSGRGTRSELAPLGPEVTRVTQGLLRSV